MTRAKNLSETIREELMFVYENMSVERMENEFNDVFMDALDEGPDFIKKIEKIIHQDMGMLVDIAKDGFEKVAKTIVGSGDSRKMAQTLFDLKHAVG